MASVRSMSAFSHQHIRSHELRYWYDQLAWCLMGFCDDIRYYCGSIYDLHVPSYMYALVSDVWFTFDTGAV